MPVYLKEAHGLDSFRCDCCGGIFPRIAVHEHHRVKQADGGQDNRANIAILDATCHHALHQIELALKNPRRRLQVPELLQALFPANPRAREQCLILATTAALGRPVGESAPDLSAFDTAELVHLPAPRVPPRVREMVHLVVREMKGATGRRLGIADYLRGLIEADLKRRGFSLVSRR